MKGRILTVPPTGGWKAARTCTLESVRYVAQPFQAAGSRSFPAPQRAPARVGPWWKYQDAPGRRGRILALPPERGSPAQDPRTIAAPRAADATAAERGAVS